MACGVVVAWRVIFCMSGGYVNRVPPKGSTRFGEVAGGQGVGRQGCRQGVGWGLGRGVGWGVGRGVGRGVGWGAVEGGGGEGTG